MSKGAGLRAMREARYAQRMARSTAAPSVPAPVRPAARPAAARSEAAPVAPEPASEALCGHKSMNGRSCTREQGHTAKNHRYS